MAHIAYKRVSTAVQKFDRQLDGTKVDFEVEFFDTATGTNTKRPALHACIEYLKAGDTLWVHEISRLARNPTDLLTLVKKVLDRGVTLQFVKEGLYFTSDKSDAMKSAMSEMLLTMLASVASFEAALIKSRVNEGVAVAQSKGVKFGRASEKYGANGIHMVNNTRRVAAMDSTKHLIPVIKDAIKWCGKKPTQARVAEYMNLIKIPDTKGKVDKWTQPRVGHLLTQHNLNLFSL